MSTDYSIYIRCESCDYIIRTPVDKLEDVMHDHWLETGHTTWNTRLHADVKNWVGWWGSNG